MRAARSVSKADLRAAVLGFDATFAAYWGYVYVLKSLQIGLSDCLLVKLSLGEFIPRPPLVFRDVSWWFHRVGADHNAYKSELSHAATGISHREHPSQSPQETGVLLEYGANKDLATRTGHLQAMCVLLQSGAGREAKNVSGDTQTTQEA